MAQASVFSVDYYFPEKKSEAKQTVSDFFIPRIFISDSI